MKRRLTDKQLNVYCFMREFFQDNDQLPPQNTIVQKFGWKDERNAANYQRALEAKGYLEKNSVGKYRFKRDEK